MKTINRMLLCALGLAVVLGGCAENPEAPEFKKEITVFGYLWGNERLTADHAILVAYTEPVLQYYDLARAGIRNAVVTITEEGTGRTTLLHDTADKPGFYFSDSLLVLPKVTYHLRIEVDGKVVAASTTVPPVLDMQTVLNRDAVNAFQQENASRERPIYLECESTDQIVAVDVYCNEPYQNAEYINAFHNHKYPDDQDEYDGGKNGEPRHIKALFKLKDLVSDDYPGQHVVFWYSSMLVFYGSYTMQVTAIDDNYNKFNYKEHPELNGGVTGGIGVFGSMCGATFKLQVLKP